MTLLSQSFAYQLCLSMNHNPLWGLFILLNLAFAIYFTVDSIISWQSNPTVTSGNTVFENHSKSLMHQNWELVKSVVCLHLRKVSCLLTFLLISAVCVDFAKCQLFIYFSNVSCLFTFQMSAVSFHFKCQLFVFSNVSFLFIFQMSAICLHIRCQLVVYISNVSYLCTTFEISAFCLHFKC